MYHVGKVVRIFSPNPKTAVSTDSSVQAHLEMWDENQIIVSVHPSLAAELKEADIVLARYVQPEPVIIKILRGKAAEQAWKAFRSYFSERKRSAMQQPLPISPMDLDVPDERPHGGPMVR